VCWCVQKAWKYKSGYHNGGHDNFLLNCNVGCKKTQPNEEHALIAWRFSQALLKKGFTSKWWLSSKVKAWNFTKNKLLKFVNSMKADFLFDGVNMNIINQKKRQKKTHFKDEGMKKGGH